MVLRYQNPITLRKYTNLTVWVMMLTKMSSHIAKHNIPDLLDTYTSFNGSECYYNNFKLKQITQTHTERHKNHTERKHA